jgi:hypothetical protein
MRRYLAGSLLVVAVGVLAGCTTDSATELVSSSSVPEVPAPSVTQASPTPLVFPVSPEEPGSQTIALAGYDRQTGLSDSTGSQARLAEGAAYVVIARCVADVTDVTIGYVLEVDGAAVNAGDIPCDGSQLINSALVGTGANANVFISLTSDLDAVLTAYAAVVPQSS